MSLTLEHLSSQRHSVTRTGLRILAGWALANIVFGATFRALPAISNEGFWEMTALWNVVNLVLAATGLRGIRREKASENLAQEIRSVHTLEKVLLFNGGLDVGYVLLGILLTQLTSGFMHRSYDGWGVAIIVQGLFLFVFDLGFARRVGKLRGYETLLSGYPISQPDQKHPS